jgi:hypothetical protein
MKKIRDIIFKKKEIVARLASFSRSIDDQTIVLNMMHKDFPDMLSEFGGGGTVSMTGFKDIYAK